MIASFQIQITSLEVTVSSLKKMSGLPQILYNDNLSLCINLIFSPLQAHESSGAGLKPDPREWMVCDSRVAITVLGGGEARKRVLASCDFERWVFHSELWWSPAHAHGRVYNSRLKSYIVLKITFGFLNLRNKIKISEEVSPEHSYSVES